MSPFKIGSTSILFLIFISSFSLNKVYGVDIVKMNTGGLSNDFRVKYRATVLEAALDATIEEFGPYEIKIIELPTTPSRAIQEIYTGQTINLFIGVTTQQWEETNVAIPIPIRRGILSYRLLAVHKKNLHKFANVSTLDDLKRLAGGVRGGWATTKVLKDNGLSTFELTTLNGLYNMLDNDAIDYIPRGINEIYGEIEIRNLTDIVVEPNLILLMHAPTYIIVSPSEKRLAKRIEAGLEKLVANGRLKIIFYESFGENLRKSNLPNRKIIPIPNQNLPKTIPFDRNELWFFNDAEQVLPK